jgi:hypothetical protein
MMTGEAQGLPGLSNYRYFDGCEMKILYYAGRNNDWRVVLAGETKQKRRMAAWPCGVLQFDWS